MLSTCIYNKIAGCLQFITDMSVRDRLSVNMDSCSTCCSCFQLSCFVVSVLEVLCS